MATESFYIFMIPKGLNFTEEKYELFKFFFERYVKGEKVKEKLEKIKKDFVCLYFLKKMNLII